MKKASILYDYNPDSGTASVIITDKQGRTFCGIAQAHPQDKDMANEKTGLTIALSRAEIKKAKAQQQDLRLKLKAIKHLYNVLLQSKKFDPTDYTAKMIRRNIKHLKDDIEEINILISNYQNDIKFYIEQKEQLYQIIRKNRKGQN